jgi:hypothetical protein
MMKSAGSCVNLEGIAAFDDCADFSGFAVQNDCANVRYNRYGAFGAEFDRLFGGPG